MVKDEQAVIEKTLEPFVKAGINSFLIFDTGSTDNTIPIIQHFFKKHNVQRYHIIQEPFIDFATSRNRALDLADELFPESPFFLMPDAEWYIHNVQGLIDFCTARLDKDIACYLIRLINEEIDFGVFRLIRAKSHPRFIGVVHETIPVSVSERVPREIYFELGISKQGTEKSRQRWERDLALLLKEYEKNPNDSRTTFFLAQTYECLGDWQNAYHYYKIRSQQQGWLEEDYETMYRLGYVTEALSASDSNYTWHMAYDYYCTAHGMLPHRAEPLVRIADHYCRTTLKNGALGYLFAKRACELPYPEHDYVGIDTYVYNFKRYELLSIFALGVGDIASGESATRKALHYKEVPYLLGNLATYIDYRMQAG